MCMVDCADGYNEMFKAKIVKARKEHKCGECRRQISKGENYHKAGGRYDGDWWSSKQCLHCHQAAQLLIMYCGGFLYDHVWEDLEDHICELLPWSYQAARLTICMKRKWQRFDGGGLMAEPQIS